MPDYAEFRLADDSVVRLELAPVGELPPEGGESDDLPEGFTAPVPVARGSRAGRAAVGTLQVVLRPLGLVLQEVHDSLAALPDPPQEVSVELGVQIGQDLRLGIVGVNGQASMKVCATWQPRPAAAAAVPTQSGAEAPPTPSEQGTR